jgi:hypothetical protein
MLLPATTLNIKRRTSRGGTFHELKESHHMSEITLIDETVYRFWYMGAAQKLVDELKKENVNFCWTLDGKLQY